jgi:hypothetical protein
MPESLAVASISNVGGSTAAAADALLPTDVAAVAACELSTAGAPADCVELALLPVLFEQADSAIATAAATGRIR